MYDFNNSKKFYAELGELDSLHNCRLERGLALIRELNVKMFEKVSTKIIHADRIDYILFTHTTYSIDYDKAVKTVEDFIHEITIRILEKAIK